MRWCEEKQTYLPDVVLVAAYGRRTTVSVGPVQLVGESDEDFKTRCNYRGFLGITEEE